VDAGGHSVVLIRFDDEVHALDGWCPHRMGPLTEGHIEGNLLRCPWHGFKYDIRTGELKWPYEATSRTADDPLPGHGVPQWNHVPTYPIRVTADGVVEIAVEVEGD